MSDVIQISTGVPQGCVLSPLLFSMYTSDFNLENDACVITKYADDTALTGLITSSNEADYRIEINRFIDWCKRNHFVLNVHKTKEIIFDFRKIPNVTDPVEINNVPVEIVHEFKYLGTVVDDKLNWNLNTTKICKKKLINGFTSLGNLNHLM